MFGCPPVIDKIIYVYKGEDYLFENIFPVKKTK